MKMSRNKKGISVLVSTVLLIVFVVSLGLLVASWSSRIVGSGIEKSKSKIGSSLECSEVNIRLEGGTGEGELIVKNNGETEIAGFISRIIENNNAYVDYKNINNKIRGYNAIIFDYSEDGKYQYQNQQGEILGEIDYADIGFIEIIPRIELDDVLVDCEMKKIKWEKV